MFIEKAPRHKESYPMHKNSKELLFAPSSTMGDYQSSKLRYIKSPNDLQEAIKHICKIHVNFTKK
jgi:hypothetical protein